MHHYLADPITPPPPLLCRLVELVLYTYMVLPVSMVLGRRREHPVKKTEDV